MAKKKRTSFQGPSNDKWTSKHVTNKHGNIKMKAKASTSQASPKCLEDGSVANRFWFAKTAPSCAKRRSFKSVSGDKRLGSNVWTRCFGVRVYLKFMASLFSWQKTSAIKNSKSSLQTRTNSEWTRSKVLHHLHHVMIDQSDLHHPSLRCQQTQHISHASNFLPFIRSPQQQRCIIVKHKRQGIIWRCRGYTLVEDSLCCQALSFIVCYVVLWSKL